VKAVDRYVALAVQQGVSVTVVNQTGYVLRNGAERKVAVRYIPLEEI
jgi:hypothetical protein